MAIFKSTVETKCGQLLIEADHEYIRSIKRYAGDVEVNENDLTRKAAKQLSEYFAGKRQSFNLPLFFENSFYGRVYKEAQNIKYGTTVSYKELATELNSRAVRAVGTAMKNNPYSVVIPCHRVIKSNGELGAYYNGLDMKEQLLDLEAEFLIEKHAFQKNHFSQEVIDNFLNFQKVKELFEGIEIVREIEVYKNPFVCLVMLLIAKQESFLSFTKQRQMLFKRLGFNFTVDDFLELDDRFLKKLDLNKDSILSLRKLSMDVRSYNVFWERLEEKSNKETIEFLSGTLILENHLITEFLIYGLGRSDIDAFVVDELNLSSEEETAFLDSIKGNETFVTINMWELTKKSLYL